MVALALDMIGKLVHVGGPPPLRAGVTYAYPFELYAPHLGPASGYCLRLPWVQRHASDDVGVCEHEEQDAFVRSVLRDAAVPCRTAAPGEHVFPDRAAAEAAVLALALALGADDWI